MKLPTRPETFACHPAEVAGDGFSLYMNRIFPQMNTRTTK